MIENFEDKNIFLAASEIKLENDNLEIKPFSLSVEAWLMYIILVPGVQHNDSVFVQIAKRSPQ